MSVGVLVRSRWTKEGVPSADVLQVDSLTTRDVTGVPHWMWYTG